MNKLKVYISPGDQQRQHQLEKNINSSNYQHEYNADLINKNISNTIKKFSSERSLFFSNLNDAINDCNNKWMGEEQAIRFKDEGTTMSRPRKEVASGDGEVVGEETVRLRRNEPTNASCKMPSSGRASMVGGEGGGGGNRWKALLRRCKSSKNLFTTGFMGNHSSEKTAAKEEKLPSFRKTDNLDEFDKYYLFSGNRKNIVKELRKNFETPGSAATSFVEVHNNEIKESSDKQQQVNKCTTSSGTETEPQQQLQQQQQQKQPQNITRKARRFFEIFSSGKNQNIKAQKKKDGTAVAAGEVLKKTNNKDNKTNTVAASNSVMCEISTQTMEDDLMEPFYLHDKYGAQSRRNLNSVFYGANTSSAGSSTDTQEESQDSLDGEQSSGPKVSPTGTQSSLLRSKVMEKYGDRMRESESFSKFLSHTSSPGSTPKLKAVNKIDPDLLHKPRNNTLNMYGPRRNSTSNLEDLQRCDMVIENDFESLPPPLNPTLQQQYLDATKKQKCGQTAPPINLAPAKNLKNYSEKLLANSEHLKPKVNNIEEDLYMLNNNKTRKFAHIKSDSANNVSDFDVELRGELDDFVDPKWCSYTSINSGFGHASFYRQFGKIRKVIYNKSTHNSFSYLFTILR